MTLELSDFFKALGDETRQRIINLLIRYPALNVNDLVRILGQPQSKVSRHLATLRHTKWLVFTRRDKWIYYKLHPDLNQDFLKSLENLFKNYLQFESDIKNAQKLL